MTVGIVGMGYVGLPLAVAFASAGHRVIAMDSDTRKVAALEARESYIEDIPSAELEAMGDLLAPTTRVGPLGHADAVLLCVPTPLTANREPDLGPLLDATQALARVLRAGQLVVLESTS
jgi:UDP-N-acetyl-D-glucosamine dehydrogenase